MSKTKDYTGETFGRLTVLETFSKNGRRYCKCECSCENHTIKDIRTDGLVAGQVLSCGCLHKEKVRQVAIQLNKNKLIDLTGKKFGKWTVLRRGENRNGKPYWWCECDCPRHTIKEVSGAHLRSGESLCCGCGKLEDLRGQTFTRWTVKELDIERTDKEQTAYWFCQCSCKNATVKSINASNLKRGLSKSCGCLDDSSGEYKIKTILKNANITFYQEYSYTNLKSKNNVVLRYDFYLPDYNCLIEFDGEQHFYQKGQGHGYFTDEKIENIHLHDNMKNKYCIDNKITLIRIPYTHYDALCLEDLLPETSSFIYQ